MISDATNFPVNAKFVHRVDNAQECINALCLFANHCLVNVEINAVMVEVLLHLLSIDIEDVHIHDSQTTTPSRVAVGQFASASIENVVDEGKVVLDLLVPFNVEAIWPFGNRGFEVRHAEYDLRMRRLC